MALRRLTREEARRIAIRAQLLDAELQAFADWLGLDAVRYA